VHVAAVALVTLLLIVVGPPERDMARNARKRVVDLAYLAPPEPAAATILPATTPLEPGSAVRGADLEVRPPGPVEEAPEAEPTPSTGPQTGEPRGRTTGSAPRAPAGTPARTVVVVSPWDGELSPSGGGGDSPSPVTVVGEGPDPGEPGFPTLTLGPPDSPTTVSLGTRDPRYVDYLGSLAPLLDSEWRNAFPRERALFMQQGEIVLEWTIGRDGSIGEPKVVRPSGVPPFDRNVLDGFRRAARRFPPPPPTMPLPLRILAPVRFANPMME
jgi:TonB family protein